MVYQTCWLKNRKATTDKTEKEMGLIKQVARMWDALNCLAIVSNDELCYKLWWTFRFCYQSFRYLVSSLVTMNHVVAEAEWEVFKTQNSRVTQCYESGPTTIYYHRTEPASLNQCRGRKDVHTSTGVTRPRKTARSIYISALNSTQWGYKITDVLIHGSAGMELRPTRPFGKTDNTETLQTDPKSLLEWLMPYRLLKLYNVNGTCVACIWMLKVSPFSSFCVFRQQNYSKDLDQIWYWMYGTRFYEKLILSLSEIGHGRRRRNELAQNRVIWWALLLAQSHLRALLS